jgi:hypothetical protein
MAAPSAAAAAAAGMAAGAALAAGSATVEQLEAAILIMLGLVAPPSPTAQREADLWLMAVAETQVRLGARRSLSSTRTPC